MRGNGALERETPPRAWGRHIGYIGTVAGVRNTPTGVGKTRKGVKPYGAYRKHPHGRGEDPFDSVTKCAIRETPPRAWGRRAILG